MVNGFDSTILSFFNQFANVSSKFDFTVYIISESKLIKGGVLTSLLWWAWFSRTENNNMIRRRVISIQFSCLIAIFIGRMLSLTLPHRSRPIHEKSLDFVLPQGIHDEILQGWSSFPSDHAVLFFSMATGLIFISKRIGIFALIFTFFIIGLPRIYLGLHYPTDILGGMVVGVGTGWLITHFFSNSKLSESILRWSETNPQYFYPLFFFIKLSNSGNVWWRKNYFIENDSNIC
jgi:undecaprenyl-diphosphatase